MEKDVLWPAPSVKSTDPAAFDTGFLPKVPSPRGPEPSRKPLADHRGISEEEELSGTAGRISSLFKRHEGNETMGLDELGRRRETAEKQMNEPNPALIQY